jgi:hypothetical protein
MDFSEITLSDPACPRSHTLLFNFMYIPTPSNSAMKKKYITNQFYFFPEKIKRFHFSSNFSQRDEKI